MPFCGSRQSDVLEPGNQPATQKPRNSRFGRSRASSAKVDPIIETPSREGLSTAPSSTSKQTAPLHSSAARVQSAPPKERKSRTSAAKNDIFMLEGFDGPTAEEVDEYISSVLGGASFAADLRSATWGDRLRGLEMLQARVEAKGSAPVDEREKLFKVCVTVLARLLHDKIVPVYLPALQLLQLLYSSAPGTLEGLAMLGSDAAAVLVPHVVLRAGSSNVRAREESASAIMTLAASKYAGAVAVCPHAIRPLANNKVASAAGGRLELLHSLIIRYGFGSASGIHIKDAVSFLLPFYDEANDRTREAAQGIVREALTADPQQTVEFIRSKKPQLAKTLAVRAGLEKEEDKHSTRSVAPGAGLDARPLPRIARGSHGEAQGGFWAKGGFGDENVVVTASQRSSHALPEVKKPTPRMGSTKFTHAQDNESLVDSLLVEAAA